MTQQQILFSPQLRRLPSLALLLLILGIYIAQRFAVSIEAVQTALFPIFILLFTQLPMKPAYRLPLPCAAAAFICWGAAALNVRGYLPELRTQERIVLGRLEGDEGEIASRELLRRYNAIAQAYSLPKMEIVVRRFDDAADARSWLASRRKIDLLLSGTAEWLRVFFPAVRLELAGSILPPGEFPPPLVQAAAVWDIPLDDKIRVVKVPGIPAAVVLAVVPQSLSLPGQPSELSRHYLGWLAEGIGEAGERPLSYGSRDTALGRLPGYDALQLKGFREDALAQTCLMLGSWRSPEPIALARLLAGTYQLADALAESSANATAMYEAFATLNSAQKSLRKEQHPELISLIRNNASIARTFYAGDEEQAAKVRRELLTAGSITDSEGRPTFGARLSMLNFTLLEEAGLL